MSGRAEETCEIRKPVQSLSGTDRSRTHRTDSVFFLYSDLMVTRQMHLMVTRQMHLMVTRQMHSSLDVDTHSDCPAVCSCFVILLCHEGRLLKSTFLVSAEATRLSVCLTFQTLAVSLRTTGFNIKKLHTVLALCSVFCVLYGSQNRQRLLLYTSLTDWLS